MYYDKKVLRCLPCEDLIRIGRYKDGGYLIPKRILNCTSYLISAGISTDWSFEKEFILKNKTKEFFLVDKDTSINSLFKNSIFSFKRNKSLKLKIIIILYFLYNLPRIFFFRRNYGSKFLEAYISSSKNINCNDDSITSLQLIISKFKSIPKKSSIFLKLDIEGSEWCMVDEILNSCHLLSGLAIEVHDLDSNGDNLNYLIKKLDYKGLKLVHVHPNNAVGFIKGSKFPKILELTFLNSFLMSKEELEKERLEVFKYNQKYDRPCLPSRPELNFD